VIESTGALSCNVLTMSLGDMARQTMALEEADLDLCHVQTATRTGRAFAGGCGLTRAVCSRLDPGESASLGGGDEFYVDNCPAFAVMSSGRRA
jgi:hypothetical protein